MFFIRLARLEDVPHLKKLMLLAMTEILPLFLSSEQVTASHELMGLDTTLIEDNTYYVVYCQDNDGENERIVGCGGWSKRRTLYGGNQTNGRDSSFLDPRLDPARIRAMYTDPNYVRQGIGKLIIQTCEMKAKEEGFAKFELMATLAGQPLYLSCGYAPIETIEVNTSNNILIPLVRMTKYGSVSLS